jgi:hypothetical protein
MENKDNLTNDVLRIPPEHQLTAEEVAKARQRHERKHKGDENKQHMQQTKSGGKKKAA